MRAHTQRCLSLIVTAGTALALTTPVAAQVTSEPEALPSIETSDGVGSSVGEDYHIEISGSIWNPSPAIVASSEQFGVLGSEIDFRSDLGMVRRTHNELRVTFKPARRHKLRLHWLPMRYQQSTVLQRRVVFQGVAYDVGLPVESSITWNVWRFGYEFDVIARDRGFLGVILEAQYTDIRAEIESAGTYEVVRARAPIPAIGAIGRVYISRFTPITMELTAFRLPNSVIEDYTASYVNFDIYGTVNLIRMVGITVGYHSMDLSYLFDRYAGDLRLDGLYVSRGVPVLAAAASARATPSYVPRARWPVAAWPAAAPPRRASHHACRSKSAPWSVPAQGHGRSCCPVPPPHRPV